MLTDVDRRAAADALAAAERDRAPIAPLTETYPAIDADDAYAIQLDQIARKVASGRKVRGLKVGLTAKAMQQMLGVNEPDYGHLLDDMFVLEGGTIPMSEVCYPRVEPELAFVLAEPLPAGSCTAADVMRCTAYVVPALEIVDSRIKDWKIKLADTIADNGSSCRVVVGGRPTPLSKIDPRLIGVTLRINGEIIETGASGAALGNPVSCVAWLANKLAQWNVSLEAGQLILPGACTKAPFVTAGQTVRADFDGLGYVSVRFV